MTDRSHPDSITRDTVSLGEALIALATWPPAAAQGAVRSAACKLLPVMSTHTPPPYPAVSRELGEQGTTTLQVTVARNGHASGARIVHSSGFPRLDKAAASHVQQHYRWQPPACAPAGTIVKIVWDIPATAHSHRRSA